MAEATATLGRRSQGKPEDVWLKSPMYPDYYLNTFHYQVALPAMSLQVSVMESGFGRHDQPNSVPQRQYQCTVSVVSSHLVRQQLQ